jgi:hypothetical protein
VKADCDLGHEACKISDTFSLRNHFRPLIFGCLR